MIQRLEDAVQFGKSVGKLAKTKLKALGKDAKKARKKAERELSAGEAQERLDEVFSLLAQHIDTSACRDFAEADSRTSLVVDGEALLEDVPVRLLLPLRKQLKRLTKTADELVELHGGQDFLGFATRARKLHAAAEHALREANQREVVPRDVSGPLVDYLRGDAPSEPMSE